MDNLSKFQFNLILVVALGLLVFFSVAPYFGLEGTPSPLVITGFGMIMGYLFTKRDKLTKEEDKDKKDGGDSEK